MMDELSDMTYLPFEEIEKARITLKENGLFRTPLIPLNVDIPNKKVYLKLENLQPVKSFKIRGACNAICNISPDRLKDGIYTCSAGNFAQGVAWMAQKLNIPAKIIVPDTVKALKLDAIKRLGADVLKLPHEEWWSTMVRGHYEGMPGTFLHPVCMRDVITGNGTIGIEIFEDLPSVDTIICPWGGGGNCTGIASAMKHLKPSTKIIACEVETGAPLTESREAGRPVSVANHRISFVDGMNGKALFTQMWNLAQNLVHDTVVLSSEDIGNAVQMIVERNSIVAEGAGAATVAAALTDQVPDGNIVCLISGGNIASEILAGILQGQRPT